MMDRTYGSLLSLSPHCFFFFWRQRVALMKESRKPFPVVRFMTSSEKSLGVVCNIMAEGFRFIYLAFGFS